MELVWGIDDPHDLERQVPKLHLVEDISFLTMPALVSRMSKPWFPDAIPRLLGRWKFYRNLVHHLRYAFPA